ncbi:MAG: AarF/ABC1/UbiB kinase family protein [Oculatellaceae cyanobacterium Prado106]|jgi:predicted unusual protein kinase regulating ubiquinone biosynthesis (AarF/ABC1/UbiB family)|nr:AarF/ABC1/UbiB kinase family protein [Oculatellaceae cyanobacterium Prado106]
MSALITPIARQRDIIEVLIRYGWDYMRQLLTLGKGDEPEIPAPEILCKILRDLGPVYVKLGQLLSTRPDLLPPSYIEALSNLQSNVPPVPWVQIEAELRQQLGMPLDDVFAEISETAIAAGSIAQIHRATLKNGESVAVKIQRPGIDTIVSRDISVFKQIAMLLETTNFGKRYSIVALADEFSTSLQKELNFNQEATYTDDLRRNLASSRWFDTQKIVIPKVYHELSGKKILVLEWLEGKPILQSKFGKESVNSKLTPEEKDERQAFTTLLFRAFLQQYLIDGFFHADPHPGNLFYLEDGRAGILDCGMMGVLDSRTQYLMVELILAIIDADPERCAQVTLQLAKPMDVTQPINVIRLQTDYDRLLRRYLNVNLSNLNVGEAFGAILQAARMNNLKLPSNIGLLTKSLANLEGAGREFDPTVNIVEEITPLMSDLFRQQLMGKDPTRSFLRTALEFKELSLESPRQIGFLLNRLSSETLRLNLSIQDFNALRRTLDDAANRRSFSTVVGSLIIGAAILSTGQQTPQVHLIGNIFFGAASLLGLWLIFTILRSGRFK